MTFQLNEIFYSHEKDEIENIFWIIHDLYAMTKAIQKNHISTCTQRRTWAFGNNRQ